jgi:hypothetical protein
MAPFLKAILLTIRCIPLLKERHIRLYFEGLRRRAYLEAERGDGSVQRPLPSSISFFRLLPCNVIILPGYQLEASSVSVLQRALDMRTREMSERSCKQWPQLEHSTAPFTQGHPKYVAEIRIQSSSIPQYMNPADKHA